MSPVLFAKERDVEFANIRDGSNFSDQEWLIRMYSEMSVMTLKYIAVLPGD